MVNIIKPILAFRGALTPIDKNKVTMIVEHHMAHPTWNIIDVHNFHKNSNVWAGIGYNFWIGFDGKIYQARGFNVGAHVAGYNSTTIGVGYQGDFTKQKMPDAQLQAGIALNKWLMTQLPNVKSIVGHRDIAATTCPGKNFRMDELKKGVMGSNVYTPPQTQTKPSIVAKPSQSASNIAVDGKWGKDTNRLLQAVLGTPVDGILSGQVKNSVTNALYGGVTFNSGTGSVVIRALQRRVGAKEDGLLGPNTVKAMQAYFETVRDGVLSRPSLVVKAMQKRLNEGKL